jgi:L-fuconolactonase
MNKMQRATKSSPKRDERASDKDREGSTLSRRRFLKSSAGLGLALANPTGLTHLAAQEDEAKVSASLPIIDTHQHLWDLSKLRLPWIQNPSAKPLARSFLVRDYDEATRHANVVKTVYMEVNCDPSQHESEADSVLNICRSRGSRMRGAVIGGAVQSPAFKDYIMKYASDSLVKGVRMVLHNADRPKGMCLERSFVENVQLLGKLGLSFDLCMRPAELLDGVRLIERCPQTRFIIDHCGNMDVQSTDSILRKAWEQGIKAAAAQEKVVCKISGIVVTANPKNWKAADLAPVVNFCLDAFGEDRVVFGGDWPVCTLRATYQQWLDALTEIVGNRTPEFRRKLFHDNAAALYQLG